ncbi:hypothetical protein NDU88_004256 [Pleurodeles waltl]|uniref:Uncharacterized protein n=1 Tax=Pleurodeles waltl TaxID=8319 RepID=A0AAV7M9K1_PLEWA|nr:hypothetical protein NDU88_004256 [Pleurodeles waltl]
MGGRAHAAALKYSALFSSPQPAPPGAVSRALTVRSGAPSPEPGVPRGTPPLTGAPVAGAPLRRPPDPHESQGGRADLRLC